MFVCFSHMLHIWDAFAYCAFQVCYCIYCIFRILTYKVKLVKVHMHNTQDNFTLRTRSKVSKDIREATDFVSLPVAPWYDFA